MKFFTKKSLGQHFLLNPSTIDKILSKACVSSEDRVLEIGPGPGLMTARLAQKAGRVIAVEKDTGLLKVLQEKMAEFSHVTLLEGDFLSMDLKNILIPDDGPWKVIANLPYNVATEIIFRLFESRRFFSSFYLMVQREVAERLVARPNADLPKDYGFLSVMSQLYSANRIVMRLPPGAFTPPPKVHSAIVEFQVSQTPRLDVADEDLFRKVVQAAFQQRRKTIENSLQGGFSHLSREVIREALRASGIEPSLRAETIAPERFAALARQLAVTV